MKQYIAVYNTQEIREIEVIGSTLVGGLLAITFVASDGGHRTWRKFDTGYAIHERWVDAQADLISRIRTKVNEAKSEVCLQESRLRTVQALRKPKTKGAKL